MVPSNSDFRSLNCTRPAFCRIWMMALLLALSGCLSTNGSGEEAKTSQAGITGPTSTATNEPPIENGTQILWESGLELPWAGLAFEVNFSERCLVTVAMAGKLPQSSAWMRLWDEEGTVSGAIITRGAGLQLAGNAVGLAEDDSGLWYANAGLGSGEGGTIYGVIGGSHLAPWEGNPSARLALDCSSPTTFTELAWSANGSIFTSSTMENGSSLFVQGSAAGNVEAAAAAGASKNLDGDAGLVQLLIPSSDQVSMHRATVTSPDETTTISNGPFDGKVELVRGPPGTYSVEVSGGGIETESEIVVLLMGLNELASFDDLP